MKYLSALLLALFLPNLAVSAPVTNSKGEEVFLFDWHKQPAFKKLWHEQVGKHAPKASMHNWVRKNGWSHAAAGKCENRRQDLLLHHHVPTA